MTSLLNQEAQERYLQFVKATRGVRPWLYWDEGVRIGVGYRLEKFGDVMSLALEIEGRLATQAECLKDWGTVKLNRTAHELPCRLREDVLDILVTLEVKRNIAELPGFTLFRKWPWQAQLVGCLIGIEGLRANKAMYHACRTMRWDDAAAAYNGPWQRVIVETLRDCSKG